MKKYLSTTLFTSVVLTLVFVFNIFVPVTKVEAQFMSSAQLVDLFIQLGIIPADKADAARQAVGTSLIPLFRLYNTGNQSYLYTTSLNEKNLVSTYRDWVYEGISGYVYETQVEGTKPVYRLFNSTVGDHFYTIDAYEKSVVAARADWTAEGIAGYMYSTQATGTVPASRLYNNSNRIHYYATNQDEINKKVWTGEWVYEGIMGYLFPGRNIPVVATTTPNVVATTTIAATGTINIVGIPTGATVFVDNSLRGVTPLVVLNQTPGNHSLTIGKSGYTTIATTTRVVAGATSTINYTMTAVESVATGTLSILNGTPSGANISVDGISKGIAPQTLTLPVGYHPIIISKSGYISSSTSAVVSAGVITSVNYSLVEEVEEADEAVEEEENVAVLNPAIKITYPNGGETIKAGASHTIRYTLTDTSEQPVLISLLDISGKIYDVGLRTGTNGSITVSLPATTQVGVYKVRLQLTAANGVKIEDTSDEFFWISKPQASADGQSYASALVPFETVLKLLQALR